MMPEPVLAALAGSLMLGPAVDDRTLGSVTGTGIDRTAIITDARVPTAAGAMRIERTIPAEPQQADSRSSITLLLHFGGITMGGQSVAGPLTIAVRADGNIGLRELGEAWDQRTIGADRR